MSANRASRLLDEFSGKRVIVVGDVMLDEYIWGRVSRISPEAPVLVVDAERQSAFPGGAANVVNNLRALGAIGIVFGVIGDDAAGKALCRALADEGADTGGLTIEPGRPTTRKTRIIAHSQQVVRVDNERRTAPSPETVAAIAGLLEATAAHADAILISDYQKGVLTTTILDLAISLARKHGKPVAGNLKPPLLDRKFGATVITLNVQEAGVAVGAALLTATEIERAGYTILDRTGAENVVVTLGANGMTLFSSESRQPYHVMPHLVEVYDTAGARDTVIAAMTLAISAGATLQEAVRLANDAAAQAVKKVGVSTVSRAEMAVTSAE